MPISGHEPAAINMDGPIFSYTRSVSVGGEHFDVAAFVPGQSRVFQMIDGQLTVFDPDTEQYQAAGPPNGLQIGAIGFSPKDDLLYGISKANGIDATGAAVTARDLVMVDAHGKAYRVGETPVGDYVGDFDDAGNFWAFQSNLNRVTRIDVNTPDAQIGELPTDEAALAVITRMSDDFDIQNLDGQAIYRAAVSMRAVAPTGMARH